jgi:hypothetical protein
MPYDVWALDDWLPTGSSAKDKLRIVNDWLQSTPDFIGSTQIVTVYANLFLAPAALVSTR